MKYLMGVSFLIATLFSGCTDTTQEKEIEPKAKVVQQEITVKSDEMIKSEKIEEVAQELKDKTSDVIDTAAQMAKELSKESKVIADDIRNESKKVITKIAKETKEVTAVAVETLTEVKKDLDVKMDDVIQMQESGLSAEQISQAESLYLKCAGCHGQKGERAALNKSEIIQGWQVEQIFDALKGYKDGTYGSVMKGLMQGQVANLTQEQLQLLSEYISTLK